MTGEAGFETVGKEKGDSRFGVASGLAARGDASSGEGTGDMSALAPGEAWDVPWSDTALGSGSTGDGGAGVATAWGAPLEGEAAPTGDGLVPASSVGIEEIDVLVLIGLVAADGVAAVSGVASATNVAGVATGTPAETGETGRGDACTMGGGLPASEDGLAGGATTRGVSVAPGLAFTTDAGKGDEPNGDASTTGDAARVA